jgi:hypothetical protein
MGHEKRKKDADLFWRVKLKETANLWLQNGSIPIRSLFLHQTTLVSPMISKQDLQHQTLRLRRNSCNHTEHKVAVV